jgi:tetratricopeptide (TPR) repeat protein
MGKKWLMVWNAREVEDSDDYYIYQQWSGLLSFLGWINHFGLLAPLAAAGFWLTRHQWRRLWLLYAMTMGLAAGVAIFYVFGRYRFPLVPLLTLFAGAGLVESANLYRQRAWRPLLSGLAVFLFLGAVVNWSLYGIAGAGPGGYNNLANAYSKQGRIDEAIRTALKAIELQPGYGVAHYNLGNLYAQQGRFDLAQTHFEEVVRLYPNYAEAHNSLGQLMAERHGVEKGIAYFRKAIEHNPSLSRAYLNLGVALAKQGRLDEAIGPLQQAVQLMPNSAEASYYLGSVYAAQNRYVAAAESFYQSLRVQPDFVPAHQSLVRLLLLQGKKQEAMQHYQEAVRLMKRRQPGAGGG